MEIFNRLQEGNDMRLLTLKFLCYCFENTRDLSALHLLSSNIYLCLSFK